MPFRSLFSIFSSRRNDRTNPSSSGRGTSSRYDSSHPQTQSYDYATYLTTASRDYLTRQARREASRAARHDDCPVDYGTLGGSAYERFGTTSRSESTRQARRAAQRSARNDYDTADYGTLGGSAYDGCENTSRSRSTRQARREARSARDYANYGPIDYSTLGFSAYDRPSRTERYQSSSRYGSSGGDRLAQEASRRRHNVSPLGTSRFEQPYAGPSSRSHGRSGKRYDGHGNSYDYYR